MANSTRQEMKKPVPWQWLIGILVAIGIPIVAGSISIMRDISSQQVRIQKLETEQYNNQLKVEKEFDKLGVKMDEQSKDIRQILIEMQNKQARK